jgi:hypothetical protein
MVNEKEAFLWCSKGKQCDGIANECSLVVNGKEAVLWCSKGKQCDGIAKGSSVMV